MRGASNASCASSPTDSGDLKALHRAPTMQTMSRIDGICELGTTLFRYRQLFSRPLADSTTQRIFRKKVIRCVRQETAFKCIFQHPMDSSNKTSIAVSKYVLTYLLINPLTLVTRRVSFASCVRCCLIPFVRKAGISIWIPWM